MKFTDAISLIQHPLISATASASWADLGCGAGLFTFALANLLQKESTIYAVDRSPVALQQLANPHHISIRLHQMDFVKDPLPYTNLDGMMMANSFHYVADKRKFIAAAEKRLSANGIFLLVEYDTDTPNTWVPYPVSAGSLQQVFKKAGYHQFIKLGQLPSAYRTANIYAAIIKK